MPVLRLTKRVIESAVPKLRDYEIRDSIAPGFLCKVGSTGRKTFMLQYRTLGGERRKPAIALFGELTVEQARDIARDWLAEVRQGKDPSLDKQRARLNPTVAELCDEFITRHSIPHNEPSTVSGNRSYIRKHIKPRLGKLKTAEVTRADISRVISDLAATPAAANSVLGCLKKMFNCTELGASVRTAPTPAGSFRNIREASARASSKIRRLPGCSNISTAPTKRVWSIPPRHSRFGSSSLSPPECRKSPAWNGSGSTSRSGESSGPTARPAASRSH